MADIIIKPIAHIRTDFSSKFGIPRQSGIVTELRGRVVFEPEYRQIEALREIEGFSHIWLIWQFSMSAGAPWHATVRPPKLGGNRRVGVFASRSPFRPNSLGLSCVRLDGVELDSPDSPALLVSGVDLMDMTPIFDIKPYVLYADCHPEASEGFTVITKESALEVSFPPELLALIPEGSRGGLLGVLKNDPRPGYADSPEKEYGLEFAGFDVGFRVRGDMLEVRRVTRL